MVPHLHLSVLAAYFACFGSLFLTSWMRGWAEEIDFVDRPDGKRKKHARPVALGGGLAVLLAAAVSLTLVMYLYNEKQIEKPSSLIGLAIAAVMLCGVGLYDDAYNLRGVYKLIWQFIAASLVVALGDEGLFPERMVLFGFTIDLGFLGMPLAMLWIVAAVNSFNLIDGMDGLAATVGVIVSVAIGCMALVTYQSLDAIIAFAMGGALLGFLRHNWPPARIYLGDAGSMLIGVVLGTLALRCQFKEVTSLQIATPLAIWAIPLLDSVAALLRRKLTGRSMYTTDRGHIHHRLLTRGLSNQQALYLIGAMCVMTSIGAFASLKYQTPVFGLVAFFVVILVLIGTRLFGHSELMLINSRLMGLGQMLIRSNSPRSSKLRLQGTMQWEKPWQSLVDSAERFQLVKLRLNLYLPSHHEDFFATWQQKSKLPSRQWSAEIPLTVRGETVGYLSVTGVQGTGSSAVALIDFLDTMIEPLEQELTAIVGSVTTPQERESPTGEGPVIGLPDSTAAAQVIMDQEVTAEEHEITSLLAEVDATKPTSASNTAASTAKSPVSTVLHPS